MKKICKYCGEEKEHYAKGLCKNCYNRMTGKRFSNIKELRAYDQGRRKRAEAEEKRMKERAAKPISSNEFTYPPRAFISQRVFEWYYDEDEKYLTIKCKTPERRRSAYNTIYAMTKRRHELNVKRHVKKDKIILERITADEV